MEDTASGTTNSVSDVYATLLELFGGQSQDKIEKAIDLAKQGGNNDVVQIETAIEIMFELLNQEDPPDDAPKPPPQKPSRSNVQTGTKKKTTNILLNAQVQETVITKERPIPLFEEEMSAKFLPEEYKNACDLIEKGYKVMILMRGLPGSGKSFLAKHVKYFFA